HELCLDSCSPSHVIKDRYLFAELRPFYGKFSVANSTPLEDHGIGKKLYSKVDLLVNGEQFDLELRHSTMHIVTQPKSIGHLSTVGAITARRAAAHQTAA